MFNFFCSFIHEDLLTNNLNMIKISLVKATLPFECECIEKYSQKEKKIIKKCELIIFLKRKKRILKIINSRRFF